MLKGARARMVETCGEDKAVEEMEHILEKLGVRDLAKTKHPPPERRWVTLRLKVVLRLKPPEAVRLTAGSRLGGRCDLESLPILIPFLALDISLDRFFVDRAHRRTKIPARPQMLTPIPLPQLSKLVL